MPIHDPMIIIVDRDQADHYQLLAASYDSEHDAAYAREEAEGSVAASNWHAMTAAAEELAAAVGHLFHEPTSTLSIHKNAHGLPCPLSGAHIDSNAGPTAAGSPCPNGCDAAAIVRPRQAEEHLP